MIALSPEMLGLLAPAFFAGLAVAATHVPLGQEVLKRGIIFIDLAIAQIAALGVVVGGVLFHAEGGSLSFILALLFALAGSALFGWLERTAPKYQEAFIGCAFVISASLILLLLAGDPHGGEEIQGLMAGQILWVSWKQVLLATLVYAGVLLAWFQFQGKRALLFYALFPVTITLSVQLVGVYLVFASLIIPALGAVRFSESKQLAVGYAIAVVSILTGLALSVAADLPAGPTLVCVYAIAAAMPWFFKKAGVVP